MGIIYKNGTYYGGGSGGGAEVTVDSELSSTSENPVQNKVIKAELDNKQDADDLMTSADMDDVVTPLPGVASRLPRYSTEEQIVGYWIDGKPLYQKTLTFDPTITIPQNAWTDLVDITALNIKKLVCADVHGGDGQSFPSTINVYNNKLQGFSYVGSFSLIEAITIQYTKTTD